MKMQGFFAALRMTTLGTTAPSVKERSVVSLNSLKYRVGLQRVLKKSANGEKTYLGG